MSAARIKIMRLLGAALVTLAVVPWLGVSPASAHHEDGHQQGNQECPNGSVLVAKFEVSGNNFVLKEGGGVTITAGATKQEGGSWTSTTDISWVIVKGSTIQDDNQINPPARAGTFNDDDLEQHDISHVTFCGPVTQSPSPSPSTSTATVTNTVTNTATNTVTNTVTTTAPGSTETVTQTVPTTATATVTETVPTTSTATVTQTVPTTQTVTNTVTETVPTTSTATVTNTVTETVTNTATHTNTVTETETVTNTATQTVTETQTQTTSVPVTTTVTGPGSTGTVTVTVTQTVTGTTTGGTSVLPTKIGNTTTPADDDDDDTGVLGTKTGGVLADTGLDLPVGTAIGLSFALLLAGGSLMMVPSRLATERSRRH